MKSEQLIPILKEMASVIESQKLFLTELDAVIGDGDHGLNMSKGFRAVLVKIESEHGQDIGELLKKVGMVLVSTVGGASGPLFGTAFMRMGMYLKGKEEMSIVDFKEALSFAIEGVQQRGKAKEHEKTMLDALFPMYRRLEQSIENGYSSIQAIEGMVEEAFAGVAYTKTIVATKGRASYVGERSIGHQDPGATSVALLMQAVLNVLKKEVVA